MNGKHKPWYVPIVSKCLSLNNLRTGANTKYLLRGTSRVMHVACDFELILSAFSELLCTLREISKQWCNNDMDQLSFCIFSTKHLPQWNKNKLEGLTRDFFEHTALCKFKKRLLRTFAFYLCEPRLLRNLFPYYYSTNNTLLHSTCFSFISDISRCVLSP